MKWKLVPAEPTPEMLNAASRVAVRGALAAAWFRMFEAAPQPPALSDERIKELSVENGQGCWNDDGDHSKGVCWFDGDKTEFARAIERELLGENKE